MAADPSSPEGQSIRLGPGVEFELIEQVRERLSAARQHDARGGVASGMGQGVILGSGDDAAVTVHPGAAVTSIDTVVEGVHFDLSWPRHRLADVGHKALAAALSDLAAMGAQAPEAFVALILPERVGAAGALEIADGLAACAASHGVAVLGGDITIGPMLALTVSVVGHSPDPDQLRGRAGARPGDLLCVTGSLGRAAAGLRIASDPALLDQLDQETADRLLESLYRPVPRLAAGLALAPLATAMIDLSDGLGGDAGHIAAASGVGIGIDAAAIPISDDLSRFGAVAGTGRDGLIELAISGGEDYEIALTLDPGNLEQAQQAASAAGSELTAVGHVKAGSEVELVLSGGEVVRTAGFDQLR